MHHERLMQAVVKLSGPSKHIRLIKNTTTCYT